MEIGEIIAAIVVPVKAIIISIVVAYFKSKRTKNDHVASLAEDVKVNTEILMIYIRNNGVDPKVKKIIEDKYRLHKDSKNKNK